MAYVKASIVQFFVGFECFSHIHYKPAEPHFEQSPQPSTFYKHQRSIQGQTDFEWVIRPEDV